MAVPIREVHNASESDVLGFVPIADRLLLSLVRREGVFLFSQKWPANRLAGRDAASA